MKTTVAEGDCRQWNEDAYRDSILEERESHSLTIFRTVFSPSPTNQNPKFIVAASSDGSIATYSLSSLISSTVCYINYYSPFSLNFQILNLYVHYKSQELVVIQYGNPEFAINKEFTMLNVKCWIAALI